MVKIALITEGITDQFIIKPIIKNCFKNIEFQFNSIQPPVDETDKQADFGNWLNVMNCCEDYIRLKETLLFNDYIVIQIDADVSHNKGFDVPKVANNTIWCDSIIKRLQELIPPGIWETYKERFIFAIGVKIMECWLVALVSSRKVETITNNCLYKLNQELAKTKIGKINLNNKNSYQSRKVYQTVASMLKKRKIIEKNAKTNIGFERFIKQLDVIFK